MKALMRGRNRQPRFSRKSFWAMGYGLLGSSNPKVVKDIWLWSWVMGLKVFEIQFLLETFCPFFSRIQQAMKLLRFAKSHKFLEQT
jgi:hypothetical protein